MSALGNHALGMMTGEDATGIGTILLELHDQIERLADEQRTANLIAFTNARGVDETARLKALNEARTRLDLDALRTRG